MDSEDLKFKKDFLFDVLKRYDHYIATTNFKIGLLMSFIVAVNFGLVYRLVSSFSLLQKKGCFFIFHFSFCFFSILCFVVSICFLLRAVFPETKTTSNKKSMIFFGDVSSIEGGALGYSKKINDSNIGDIVEDLSIQTFLVSEIVVEKFRLLKIAVRFLIFGAIPLLVVYILLFSF